MRGTEQFFISATVYTERHRKFQDGIARIAKILLLHNNRSKSLLFIERLETIRKDEKKLKQAWRERKKKEMELDKQNCSQPLYLVEFLLM